MQLATRVRPAHRPCSLSTRLHAPRRLASTPCTCACCLATKTWSVCSLSAHFSPSDWETLAVCTLGVRGAACLCRYHQYKFIVDGKWQHEEGQAFVTDPLGNTNNWCV